MCQAFLHNPCAARGTGEDDSLLCEACDARSTTSTATAATSVTTATSITVASRVGALATPVRPSSHQAKSNANQTTKAHGSAQKADALAAVTLAGLVRASSVPEGVEVGVGVCHSCPNAPTETCHGKPTRGDSHINTINKEQQHVARQGP